jgi:hypothetical protein
MWRRTVRYIFTVILVFVLLFDPEDGSSTFLRNICIFPPHYTASHPQWLKAARVFYSNNFYHIQTHYQCDNKHDWRRFYLYVCRMLLEQLDCKQKNDKTGTIWNSSKEIGLTLWSLSQSQSYFTTGGLTPISSSWRQAPWDSRPVILFSNWTLAVIVPMQHPLWREDGSVVYNGCCLRQLSHIQARVPRDSWPHFTVSDLRLPRTWRTRFLYLYPPGTGWPGYTLRNWVLKPDLHLSNIWESSSYLTGNTLCLRYKARPANAVQGNNRCLLWESYGIHKHNLWIKLTNLNIKSGGTYSNQRAT